MKKKKLTQRVLAVLLSASMIFGAAPVSLQAEEIQGEVLEMSVEEPVVAEAEPEAVVVEEAPAEDVVIEEPAVDVQDEILSDVPEGSGEEAADAEVVTEQEEGTVEEGVALAGELNLDDSEIVLEGIDEVVVTEEIPVETEEYAAGSGSGNTYITVEKYDAEGNGSFLLGPTAIPFLRKADSDVMLKATEIDYGGESVEDEYAEGGKYYAVTNIDGTANNDSHTWAVAKNASMTEWYNVAYYNTSAGAVYRYVYGNANITYSNKAINTKKDELIKYIADLTDEQRNKGGDAYTIALEVLVNRNATVDDITDAQTALDKAVNNIPATKITLDTESLTLGVKKSATVQAVLEPENTTDKVTWSIADTSIATVDENGKVTAQLTGGTTTLTATANDEVKAEIPVTVTAATYVTLSVEMYEGESDGTGRYLLEPTRIPVTSTTYITDILQRAVGVNNVVINYEDHNAVTGICGVNNENRYRWGFLRDGVVVQNGGDGPDPYSKVAPGQIVRVVYSTEGASRVSNIFGAANKDELLDVMSGMNARQKATEEYRKAEEVALNVQDHSVADALAGLNALPENPAVISQKEVTFRIGETFMLEANDAVTWSIEDGSVVSLEGKNEGAVNTYCTIAGKKAGITTVKATDVFGYQTSCKVTVVAPVYFRHSDGTIQEMAEDGSFTLTSIDEGRFVLNQPKDGETAVFECEDKIPVWNPNDKQWNYSFHWWVDDETGTWQPAAAKLEKKVKVSTGYFSTEFSINYQQVTNIEELKAYINDDEVTMENGFVIEGTMWTENNYYSGQEVIVKGKQGDQWITIPSQALSYETDDPSYNFRFVGNKLIINRAGTHTVTISLKQQSGLSDGAPSVSFMAVCNEIKATGMYIDVDDANNNVCYIDEWQDLGQHYVGIRPGTWDAVTGEKQNDGYHITFEPYNTTQRDVKWEVVEGADVATHSELHSDGIIPYKAGTVKFKVTNLYNEEIYQYVTVTFKYKNPLQSVSAEDSYAMAKGSSIYLNLDLNPANATEQRFNWTYDKSGIVEVTDKIESSEDGMESWTVHKIKAVGEGIVTVTGTPWDQTAGCKPVTFTVAVGSTKSDAKAVLSVYSKIAALDGTVTLNSEAAITAARKAYDALTDAQKALLGNQKAMLETAEAKLETVKKEEEIKNHKHTFGAYTTVKEATALAEGLQERTCACGYKETKTIAKLTPTIKVTATKLPMKVKQSTSGFKVTGLAKGDYVKSWKSSNTKIFKVTGKTNGTCKLTAGSKTGSATLTITLASGLKKKVTVTVQKGTVKTTKITGLTSKLTVQKGKTAALKPVLTPITSQQKFTYSSSNKKVATVNSRGVITAKAAGTANITVKSGSKKYTVKVTVPKTKTTKITGVPESVTVKKGKTYTLKAAVSPKNSDEKITYKSSNKKVATVTSKGTIKGIKKGTATITVTSGSVSIQCKVTVK
ncbi:MAG: Ig-like domain-containing protein [Candidatus Choladocola sp.]|nr:Ig-like domain-containing protein [Candidatus Choladocola sp.]